MDIQKQKSLLAFPKITKENLTNKTKEIVEMTVTKVVSEGCESVDEAKLIGKMVCESLDEYEPKDAFERLSISQMIVIYHAAMEAFRMSAIKKNKMSLNVYERLQKQGMQLMRLYCQQNDYLQKYRRNHYQGDVHIHGDGGQAIVNVR